MSKIYIARQEGNYWHEIVATDYCYETLKKWIDEQIENDIDNYHNLIITEHVIGDKKEFKKSKLEQSCVDSEVEMYNIKKSSK